MDMHTLHTRTFATKPSAHARFRPVEPRCSALVSVQHQLKPRHVLVGRCSATSGSDAAPSRREVRRMFQQHKVLIEAGFSYDQASLILEITERRATPQPAVAGMDSESNSTETPQPASAAADPSMSTSTTIGSSSSSKFETMPSEGQQQQQQQQQEPGLKGVEDRLSFLEMELLKLTLQPDAQQLLQNPAAGTAGTPPSSSSAAAAPPGLDPTAAAAAGYGTPGPWGWPGYDAVDSQPGRSLISQPELLDPEVLAIAEALLIRKGLPYSAAAFAAPPGAACGQGQAQQQQQQQQGGVRAPSSIWGRRRAAQQLRAKPWRYAEDPATAAAASTQGLMPYGYQPNNNASLIRNRAARNSSSGFGRAGRAMPGGVPGPHGHYGNFPASYGNFPAGYDPRYGPNYPAGYDQEYEGLMGPEGGPPGDDLTPYEPSGWAVAGTVLVVYAGVLLTFFALLAGAGDVGAAVDPADVMLWW